MKMDDKILKNIQGNYSAKNGESHSGYRNNRSFGKIKQKQKFDGEDNFKGSFREMNKHNSNKTLPYNFVPLNEDIVLAKEKVPSFNTYHPEKKTGFIKIEIEAISPIYIRDTVDSSELAEFIKSKKKENQRAEKGESCSDTRDGGKKISRFINYNFFSPANKIRIPGSSIRGMVRTLVEIMSYGRLKFYDGERKFFYRALGDWSLDLRKTYHDLMSIKYRNRCYGPRAKPGYLIKENNNYYIHPAKCISINGQKVNLFRVEEKNISSFLSKKIDNTYSYKKVFFKAQKPTCHQHKKIQLFYSKVVDIRQDVKPDQTKSYQEGYLVCTGSVKGKKHMQFVIGMPDTSHKKKINPYRNDEYRKGVNLLELLEVKYKNRNLQGFKGLPCFYIEENGEVKAFGHTLYFRLPYKNKIEDCVPSSHKRVHSTANMPDLTEAIFGNEKTFAGRVFFEDAFLVNDNDPYMEIAIPKILSEPKPTAFQNYLEQPCWKKEGGKGYSGLKNYNEDFNGGSKIRGHKLYWHKKKDQIQDTWKEHEIKINEAQFSSLTDDELKKLFTCVVNRNKVRYVLKLDDLLSNEKNKDKVFKYIKEYDSQHTIIQPLKPGTKFISRIYFENLSEVELGALLTVLDLPQKCCHKIGMGKPLGLGSIRIEIRKLFLSDRKERYSNFLAEWLEEDKRAVGENNLSHEISNYKHQFACYILKKLNVSTQKNPSLDKLWNLPRMKELKSLLSIHPTPSAEYPSVKEYQKRHPLKKASETNHV